MRCSSDVVGACTAIGPTVVVAPAGELRPAGDPFADPDGGQGAAVRAGLDAAVAAGGPAPYLVVNADLPCVTARDLLALAGAVPDGGLALAAAADGTTNALALSSPDLFAPVYGPGSAARFAALGAVAARSTRRTSIDDVDTVADLERLRRRGSAREPQRCSRRCASERRVKVAVLSGGVGGARFLRGVVLSSTRLTSRSIGNVGDDVEVLGLHVSPDLDSVLYALAGVADEERGWGRADETWNALATVARARRRGVVPARRPRHRPAPRAHAAAARGRAALRGDRAARARVRPRGCALLPATDDPLRTFIETPAGTFPFQTWFVARGHRDEVDAVHYTGRRTRARRPACSRRSTRPT